MKVGSLVECINSENYGSAVTKGTIYTVRGFDTCDCGHCDGKLMHLEEVSLGLNPNGEEYGFSLNDFREVQPPIDAATIVESCMYETV